MKHRRRRSLERRILLIASLGVAPALVTSAILLWRLEASSAFRWTLFFVLAAVSIGGAFAVRHQIVRPLRSLASLIEALRAGDYSIRGRYEDAEDAFGEVIAEINALSRALHEQRLSTLEVAVLFDKLIAEVDIAVFAFDAERRLQRVNRAGSALFRSSPTELLGRTATELGLESMLDESSGRIITHEFPDGSGRWEVRRRIFREAGRKHELLVISDLSRALREEECQAWRRLIRVMGHELNSSLTPIQSIAGTLGKLIDRESLPEDWRDDVRAGLKIIRDRSEALGRFMGAYAQLARLPPPTRHPLDFGSLVHRVASIYGNRVSVEPSPEVIVCADPDQLEQVLINLIKNAVEAIDETGSVRVRWQISDEHLVAEVEDDGPGLANSQSLWVPFFTTKPGGSGIGLVLSREIVENHGGSISLQNVTAGRGCLARVVLPL